MIVVRGAISQRPDGSKLPWVASGSGWRSFVGGCWQVQILPDATMRVLETVDGVIVHDGRVEGWERNPLDWSGSFLAIGTGFPDGLQIWMDRIGTVPLFWMRRNTHLFFSSRLTDLVDVADVGPDRVGILQMALLDQPLGQRTVLAGVSLLPPASSTVLRGDGASEPIRYWRPSINLDSDGSVDAWLEEGERVLQASNARVLADRDGGTVAWPVTGGLDSRCNLGINAASIHERDILFHVSDLGERAELPIARDIAAYFGHSLEEMDATEWMRGSFHFDLTRDSGEFNVGHWRLAGAARRLRDEFACRMTVDGYLLDTLLKPSFIRDGSLETVRNRQMRVAEHRASRVGLDRRGERYVAFHEACIAGYPREVDGLLATQRYTLENRSRRLVYGIVRTNQNFLDVRVPALDSELIDFAMSLPWNLRKGGVLYRRLIHRMDPRLAAFPHDKTGRPILEAPRSTLGREVFRRGKYYVNRLWPGRPIFDGKLTRFEMLLRKDRSFRHSVARVLDDSSWVSEALGGHVKATLVDQCRKGVAIADVIGALLNVALLEARALEARGGWVETPATQSSA